MQLQCVCEEPSISLHKCMVWINLARVQSLALGVSEAKLGRKPRPQRSVILAGGDYSHLLTFLGGGFLILSCINMNQSLKHRS